MKVSTQVLATSAIAFTATALAMPSMSKRVVDGTKVFGCFASAFMKGEDAWTPECAAAAATDFGFVREVSLGDFDIDFTSTEPFSMPLTLPNLQVKLASIPGISWPIKKLATRYNIIDNGVAVGMSEFPSSPTEVEGSMLKSNVGVAPLKAVPGYEDGFVNFIASLFAKPSHTFAIGGNVDIWYKVPSLSSGSESNGADSSKTLTATNIGISAPVTVRGLDNLQRVEHVKLESLTKDADSGVTTLVHTINVHNPSELSIKMGDLVFNLINADEDVKGTITLLNVNLARGDNFMRATTTFTDSDIYDSLTSESNTFTFAGFKGTAKHLVSDAVLSAYRSHLTIPKFEAA